MTEVIEVSIDPTIFESIRKAIDGCSTTGVKLDGAPIDILVPLPGNRVVLVSPDGEDLVPVDKLPEMKPLSLIPVAFFIGEGSRYSGCAVGGKYKYRRY
jgi:hypothetical protein